MDFGAFLPQCCDADGYVGIGYQCSIVAAKCFHWPLRPVGAPLWFSLPFRLGVPLAAFVVAHLVLLAVSIALSATWLTRWPSRPGRGRLRTTGWWALCAVASSAIHYFWFRPVLFHTLSDAPAGLLALIALWLCLLARPEARPIPGGMLVAGVLLGLAAWLRAFYLYPVLVSLVVFVAVWWSTRARSSRAALSILVALVPIAAQYVVIYETTGHVGYLGQAQTSAWSTTHLASSALGYDTVIPGAPGALGMSLESYLVQVRHLPAHFATAGAPTVSYTGTGKYWPSGCRNGGLLPALRALDPGQAACITLGRLWFYLGSYASTTYLRDPGVRSFSVVFFLVNSLALVAAVYAATASIREGRYPGQAAALAFVAVCVVQSLAIIPEQRFFVVGHAAMWLLAAAAVLHRVRLHQARAA